MADRLVYAAGDVIEGQFSCSVVPETLRAIVRSRLPNMGDGRSGFLGEAIEYRTGKGYGAWGYDDEIAAVRPGTQADEHAAGQVKEQVEAATTEYLNSLRDA